MPPRCLSSNQPVPPRLSRHSGGHFGHDALVIRSSPEVKHFGTLSLLRVCSERLRRILSSTENAFFNFLNGFQTFSFVFPSFGTFPFCSKWKFIVILFKIHACPTSTYLVTLSLWKSRRRILLYDEYRQYR